MLISEDESDKAIDSNKKLNDFFNYLKALNDPEIQLRLDEFKRDIDHNMHFDSSIPQGYGVGSSGALVAAVYDKYADNKITVLENLTRDKLIKLKSTFSNQFDHIHW